MTMPQRDNPNGFLPNRGNYRDLICFQKAEVIFDLTVIFCRRFLRPGDRTIDQMVQAARSGKKNILEGSKAGLTSSESEFKLTNVARASLEELLDDYRDFLRTRDLPLWDKGSALATRARKLGSDPHTPSGRFQELVRTSNPEIAANLLVCLIHQTNYMLDRLIRSLERRFIEEGGIRERMFAARRARRDG